MRPLTRPLRWGGSSSATMGSSVALSGSISFAIAASCSGCSPTPPGTAVLAALSPELEEVAAFHGQRLRFTFRVGARLWVRKVPHVVFWTGLSARAPPGGRGGAGGRPPPGGRGPRGG